MNIIKDETTERMQKCMDSLSNQFNKLELEGPTLLYWIL